VVRPHEVLTCHTLAWDPAAALAGECSRLAQDVIDGDASAKVGVPLSLGQICDGKGFLAADLALEQVPDDESVHATVEVAHPHYCRPRILALHGPQIFVQLHELALVCGVATVGTIAEVYATGHDDLARCTMLQYSPIRGSLATKSAWTQNLLNTSLKGLPLGVIIEDIRAITLPTSTPRLQLVRPTQGRREVRSHRFRGCCELVKADDVGCGRLKLVGEALGVLVGVVHIPLD